MKKKRKKHTTNSVWLNLAYIAAGVFIFLVSFIGFSARWGLTTWGELDIDEIIFQLQAPLTGTGNGMIGDYIVKSILPTAAVMIIYILGLRLLKNKKVRKCFVCACLLAALAAGVVTRNYIWKRLKVSEWIVNQGNESTFIEENYIDPRSVKLTFPEKKRNLVYIYLESMETTFADRESGGGFESNVIPELTSLAVSGEDFSGSDPSLNGGYVYTGSTNTMSAIFTHSTGLPLKVDIGNNQMDTQDSFFPKVTAIGDLLEEEGYRQVFLLGSNATFGGRRLYFKDHGDFEIRDYEYAKKNGLIPSDYKVFWGYEDEKLFSFARDTLDELSADDKPFNLTILTVDTHFEDGYVCRLCGNEFGDNQYANVMACSSRQVGEFIDWLSQQDYYKDTTVVLTGDHKTMDTDYCSDVDPDYQRRTYTAFINAAAEPADPSVSRVYSTQDTFPTTLAAMGVQIEGERLALGTNLFSSKQTLTEEYGLDIIENEIARRSSFLRELEQINTNSAAMKKRVKESMKGTVEIISYDQNTGIATVKITAPKLYLAIHHMEAEYKEKGSRKKDIAELNLKEGTGMTYIGTLDLSGWETAEGEVTIDIYLKDGSKYEDVVTESIGDLIQAMDSEESQ